MFSSSVANMVRDVKHVFRKGKPGPNLLKAPSGQPTAASTPASTVLDDASRRVRLSDISNDRSRGLDVERRASPVGIGVGRRSEAATSSSAAQNRLMESRPLPERATKPVANEVAVDRGALTQALFGEDTEVHCDGAVRITRTITTPAEITCCRFCSSSRYLVIGLTTGDVAVYGATADGSGAPVVLLRDADTIRRRMPVTCAGFVPAPEGKPSAVLVTTYGDGLVKFWRFITGECLQTLDVDEQVLALAFDCVGKCFQIAGEDGVVRVFDLATASPVGRLSASSNHALNDGHRSRVFALAAHPLAPHELLSAGWDKAVQFWDTRRPHATRHIYGPHICGEGLSIDPYADTIVTASWRRQQALQLWDYGSGELLTDLQPDHHLSMLTCAQFVGADFIAAAGGFDNVVRMIDCRTLLSRGVVVNLPQSVRCQDVVSRPEKQSATIAACYGSEALLMDTWH